MARSEEQSGWKLPVASEQQSGPGGPPRKEQQWESFGQPEEEVDGLEGLDKRTPSCPSSYLVPSAPSSPVHSEFEASSFQADWPISEQRALVLDAGHSSRRGGGGRAPPGTAAKRSSLGRIWAALPLPSFHRADPEPTAGSGGRSGRGTTAGDVELSPVALASEGDQLSGKVEDSHVPRQAHAPGSSLSKDNLHSNAERPGHLRGVGPRGQSGRPSLGGGSEEAPGRRTRPLCLSSFSTTTLVSSSSALSSYKMTTPVQEHTVSVASSETAGQDATATTSIAPSALKDGATVIPMDTDISGKEEKDAGRTEPEVIDPESKYLSGRKLALVFTGMLLSIFLVALDQTILAPAIPVIASKFNALEQIGWITSSYFLTQCAFLLLYGQVLTLFDRKLTFLAAIGIFEIGSLICGVAQDVNVLIFGRAFAGCGAAGIFVACLSIIADVTRLEQRPKLLGLFGAVFAVSSIIGPLLGGVFSDHVTWRLCFLINLPIGAITVVSILFILGPSPSPPMTDEVAEYTSAKLDRYFKLFGGSAKWGQNRSGFVYRVAALDWTGTVLMLGIITCLVLALQWGGTKYPWNSGVIGGTFGAFGGLIVLFAIYEWKFAGVTTILPLRFFKSRTQIGATLAAFFTFWSLILSVYFLPVYYQVVKDQNATTSGLSILPIMLGIVVTAGLCGGIISYIGYYLPIMLLGPIPFMIASGFMFRITPETSTRELIGLQIGLAFGIGAIMQNTIIAVQADIKDVNDVPQATGIVTFGQLIGGTLGIAVGNTVFQAKLIPEIARLAPTAPLIVRSSVEAVQHLDPVLKPLVVEAYVNALNWVFVIGVPIGFAALLSCGLIKNKSVKGQNLAAGGA